MKYIKIAISFLIVSLAYLPTFAQQKEGRLSGSIESNSILYQKDKKTGAELPDDKLGSNNYLKLDYTRGKIAVGLQYEGYFPVLLGFNKQLDGTKITNRFLTYTGDDFSFTAGHFYEQFGSGLILRSYEERSLGINNAIDGVNIAYRPFAGVEIKGLVGKHRKYFELSNGKISGADINLGLNELLEKMPFQMSVGGSWVSKYEQNTSTDELPTTVDAYAVRTQVELGQFSLYSEYVHKGEDPNLSNAFENRQGEALLINGGYTGKGFGINMSLRRLEQMDFRSERNAAGEAAMINYLPSLTRQHKYALALLHPYSTMVDGEVGGQFDLFYKIKKGTTLGGKYGTKLHFNYAESHNLDINGAWLKFGEDKLFSDASLNIEKKWNPKLKTILTYVYQEYNQALAAGKIGEPVIKAHIAIGDMQYRFSKRTTLRTELQHLFTKQDEENWVMALAELSYAPKFSFWVSDMYNYGSSKIHYYNIGSSYSKDNARFSISYARNRNGLLCVGGICRDMPAFTGFNFAFTARF